MCSSDLPRFAAGELSGQFVSMGSESTAWVEAYPMRSRVFIDASRPAVVLLGEHAVGRTPLTTRLLPGTYHFVLKSESTPARKPLVVRVSKGSKRRYFVRMD